jgi:hypothetical protein
MFGGHPMAGSNIIQLIFHRLPPATGLVSLGG